MIPMRAEQLVWLSMGQCGIVKRNTGCEILRRSFGGKRRYCVFGGVFVVFGTVVWFGELLGCDATRAGRRLWGSIGDKAGFYGGVRSAVPPIGQNIPKLRKVYSC